MNTKNTEQRQAIDELRELLEPGETIWTVVRHVSKSGMARAIDAYVFRTDESTGQPYKLWLSPKIARACGMQFHQKYEAVWLQGCGMDMGFHLVNTLSYALHGYETTDETPKPGFTFRHEWI